MKVYILLISFISLFVLKPLVYAQAETEKEPFHTVELSPICNGVYPEEDCGRFKKYTDGLRDILDAFVDKNKLQSKSREEKNKIFRRLQDGVLIYSEQQESLHKKFPSLYAAAYFDYRANQNIVFDGCGTLGEYFNKELPVLQLLEEKVGRIQLGAPYVDTTYDEYHAEDKFDFVEACLSLDKTQFIFMLHGRWSCHSVLVYNTRLDVLESVKRSTDEYFCPSEFGERVGNIISLKGTLSDGYPYKGTFNFIDYSHTGNCYYTDELGPNEAYPDCLKE